MKWEYKALDLGCWELDEDELKRLNVATRMNIKHLGNQEWELVSIYDGVAFFKRPINDKNIIINRKTGERKSLRSIMENRRDKPIAHWDEELKAYVIRGEFVQVG